MVDFAYRTLPARIVAGILDGVTIVIADYLLRTLMEDIGGSELLAAICFNLLWVLYEVTMTVRYGGTLGKLICRIRIYHVSETSYLSVTQALLRESVGCALTVLGFGITIYDILHPDQLAEQSVTRLDQWLAYATWGWAALEILTALFSSKRRAVHDFLGSSVVKRTWGQRTGSALCASDKAKIESLSR
jgi:uncharacterized RDD family membrane protein YckC